LSELSDTIAGSALDLVRSLWAELGVGDASRGHELQALDLEPLIIFTAFCAAADAQLRNRTIDWCVANSRHVSGLRLHRFMRRADPSTRRAVERYVATIVSATRKASRVGRAGPLEGPDLRRPSLIQLRLRALVGVSARAEILRLLLADPERPRTASSLVEPTGYGRGGLAPALEMLTQAGITGVERAGNRTVYRLNRPAELVEVLNGLPPDFPDWWAIFRVTEGLIRYVKGADDEPARRAASAVRLLSDLHDELQHWPAGGRPPRIAGPSSLAAFDQWARDFVAAQAKPSGSVGHTRQVTYDVHRLLLGGWIATVKEEGDQPRPLALSDGPELRPDRRARRRLKEDEVGAAADVIESMLIDMRTRDLQRSQGSLVRRQSVSDSLLPALSREFAAELLQPMDKGQSATFTQEFLQRWFANRRHRLTAAG
jgi:DNA-binding transcriptional ArsR family regulator